MAGDHDESRWSTRYYRTDCPDYEQGAKFVMATNGPDDRADPEPDKTVACWIGGHDRHRLIRISPQEYDQVGEEDEDELEAARG